MSKYHQLVYQAWVERRNEEVVVKKKGEIAR